VGEAVEDLGGFSGLETIGGGLTIESEPLTDLRGLDGLQSVGGRLRIHNCPELTSLDGLEGLLSVAGGAFVNQCWNLTEICALSNVTDIGGYLYLRMTPVADLSCLQGLAATSTWESIRMEHTALTSLAGLESIETVQDSMEFQGNAQLTDIDAISGVIWVGGVLRIDHNPNLAVISLPVLQSVDRFVTITGNGLTTLDLPSLAQVEDLTIAYNDPLQSVVLPALEEIEDTLFISSQPAMTEMDFPALSSIGKDLALFFNDSLTNLDGLTALEFLGGDLWVGSNHSLPTCEATDLRDRLMAGGWSGASNIGGNLTDSCGSK